MPKPLRWFVTACFAVFGLLFFIFMIRAAIITRDIEKPATWNDVLPASAPAAAH